MEGPVRHESELGPLMEKHAIKMTELINYIFFMNKKGLTRPPNVKQALFNQMVEEIGDQLKEWIPFLKKNGGSKHRFTSQGQEGHKEFDFCLYVCT